MRRLVLGLCVAALVAPAPAAAEPCWQRLISDWYDGRIDRVYAPACYRAALDRLPEGGETATTARDDLRRGLASSATSGREPAAVNKSSTAPALIVIVVAGAFVLLTTARMLRARRR